MWKSFIKLVSETLNLEILDYLRKIDKVHSIILGTTPWAQDVNGTYIRRSENVLDVFWTSCVRSIYVLCPGGNFLILFLKIWRLFPFVISDGTIFYIFETKQRSEFRSKRLQLREPPSKSDSSLNPLMVRHPLKILLQIISHCALVIALYR